jgi:hypothetical protein
LDADRKRVHWIRVQLPDVPSDDVQTAKNE